MSRAAGDAGCDAHHLVAPVLPGDGHHRPRGQPRPRGRPQSPEPVRPLPAPGDPQQRGRGGPEDRGGPGHHPVPQHHPQGLLDFIVIHFVSLVIH